MENHALMQVSLMQKQILGLLYWISPAPSGFLFSLISQPATPTLLPVLSGNLFKGLSDQLSELVDLCASIVVHAFIALPLRCTYCRCLSAVRGKTDGKVQLVIW